MQIEGFYYVYILKSQKDSNLYIGFTNDLSRRLQEHQQGKNISTSKRLPVELIYFESHKSKKDALRRESYFKTAKGKTTIKQILREFFLNDWLKIDLWFLFLKICYAMARGYFVTDLVGWIVFVFLLLSAITNSFL